MKQEIQPKYFPDTRVTCTCGNTWTVGSTVPSIRTDVCSACHPFFTGEQRIVDAEGQVDRFYQRLERRAQIQAEMDARREAQLAGDIPVSELDLGTRATAILEAGGYLTISDVLNQLETADGDKALLDLQGFGQKSLISLKKRLRAEGLID
jgi:large subunit ribosomal protein L31